MLLEEKEIWQVVFTRFERKWTQVEVEMFRYHFFPSGYQVQYLNLRISQYRIESQYQIKIQQLYTANPGGYGCEIIAVIDYVYMLKMFQFLPLLQKRQYSY